MNKDWENCVGQGCIDEVRQKSGVKKKSRLKGIVDVKTLI